MTSDCVAAAPALAAVTVSKIRCGSSSAAIEAKAHRNHAAGRGKSQPGHRVKHDATHQGGCATPHPSSAASTTSPRTTGPTPSGVPMNSRSPGARRTRRERCAICVRFPGREAVLAHGQPAARTVSGMDQMWCDTSLRCFTTPLTDSLRSRPCELAPSWRSSARAHQMPPACGLATRAAGTSADTGPELSKPFTHACDVGCSSMSVARRPAHCRRDDTPLTCPTAGACASPRPASGVVCEQASDKQCLSQPATEHPLACMSRRVKSTPTP